MIIVVVGPTASGKSSLAIKIAKTFNAEIINGDAFQVYQELDIGTAKPTKEEMKIVPHHLFDFRSPLENYSVMEYQRDSRLIIEKLRTNNKNIVIVGGTGLYQKATLYDYQFTEEEEKVDLSDLDNYSNEDLYNYLVSLDEKAALKTHMNNRKRVLRAIAIIRHTGKKKSEIEESQKHELIYQDVVFVGLDIERELLYSNINLRVDEMFEQGLLQEVQSLHEKYDFSLHAFQGIGYKEFNGYFNNQLTLEETKELIKKNTRNYAKRQFTFFRHQLPVQWFKDKEEAFNYVQELMK
ncbi:MAG: tRNA (adenosine(37)-N6)-dimethylallyltransferase MiaA [Bacilli bacterium]|nr:tRNA (adenosine(37)-N6)-dimethylallyltransferase MiaA [Bacilli bacterium]